MPIKERRIAVGLTQRQLATKVGLTERQLQRLESGETELGKTSINTGMALAHTLNVTIEDLIKEKQPGA